MKNSCKLFITTSRKTLFLQSPPRDFPLWRVYKDVKDCGQYTSMTEIKINMGDEYIAFSDETDFEQLSGSFDEFTAQSSSTLFKKEPPSEAAGSSLLKTLLTQNVNAKPTSKVETLPTPSLTKNNSEGKKTKHMTSELPFKSYATTTSTFSGSTSGPVYDENHPPPQPEKDRVINVEDSILTTLRQTNDQKLRALEKRLFEPNVVQVVASREFHVLQKLQRRMADDMEQSEIIMNYLADKYGEPEKKRVKFSTLQ
uniref:Uncharacterized protein n=1 Tax=Magallana gigas TaxID=29159 RepID=A0A8W8P4N0_MAGGI